LLQVIRCSLRKLKSFESILISDFRGRLLLIDWSRSHIGHHERHTTVRGKREPVPVLAFLSFGLSNGQSSLSSLRSTVRRIRIWCWPTTSAARTLMHLCTCGSLYGYNPTVLPATRASLGDAWDRIDRRWRYMLVKQINLIEIFWVVIKQLYQFLFSNWEGKLLRIPIRMWHFVCSYCIQKLRKIWIHLLNRNTTNNGYKID